MSEEQYWVLTGEGKEESESPSLSTCASGPVLPAWLLVVYRVAGSSRSRGEWVVAPGLLGPGGGFTGPPVRLDRSV